MIGTEKVRARQGDRRHSKLAKKKKFHLCEQKGILC